MVLFAIGFIVIIATLVFMKFGKRVAEEKHWIKTLCLLLLFFGLVFWINGLISMIK